MRGYQHAQEHSQSDNQRSKQRKHAHNRRLSVGFSYHEYRQAALVFFGVLLVLLALSKVGVTLVGHNVLPSSKLSRNRGIRDMEDGFGVGGARIGLENRAEQPPLVLNTQQEQDAKFVFERGPATTQPVLSRWGWRKEPEPASLVLYIAILSQPGEAGIRDAARRTWIKSVLDVNQPQHQQVAARFFVSDFGLDDTIRGALQAEAETNGDLQVVQTLSRSSETLETLVAAWEACMQTFGTVQFLIRTQASTMVFPFSLLSQLKTLQCPEGLSCSMQQLYVGAHSPANLTTAADPLYRSTLALDKYIAYMAPDTYAVSGQLILAMLELHRRSGLIFLDHEGPSVGLWISVFAATRVNTSSAMFTTPAADTAQQAACSLLAGLPVPGHAAMPPLEACEASGVDEYRSALQQACQLVRARHLWAWSGLGLPVDMETLHEDLLQCDARLFTLP